MTETDKKLSANEKSWLKHIVSGTVRNVLANEFGLNRDVTGVNTMRQFVRNQTKDSLKQAISDYFKGNGDFEHLVEREVKLAVKAEVKRLLGEKLEAVTDEISFNITISKSEPFEHPFAGRF